MTQGTLLRLHMTMAVDTSAKAAWQTLQRIVSVPGHHYWDDGFGFVDVDHRHLQGAKQVTDAWLAALARHRRGKLATFDSGFARIHADVAEHIPMR